MCVSFHLKTGLVCCRDSVAVLRCSNLRNYGRSHFIRLLMSNFNHRWLSFNAASKLKIRLTFVNTWNWGMFDFNQHLWQTVCLLYISVSTWNLLLLNCACAVIKFFFFIRLAKSSSLNKRTSYTRCTSTILFFNLKVFL